MMEAIRSLIRNKKVKKWVFRPFLFALALQSLMSIPVAGRNYLTPSTHYAAVVISDYTMTKYDYWISPAVIFCAFPFVTTYFNNRGLRTYWYLRGESRQLEKVIQDPSCESILLVGHGTYQSWLAVDRNVTLKEVRRYMEGMPKKKGEWIQLTCAMDEGYPQKLGDLVMDPANVYTYDREVNSLPFVLDILTGFRYIKSLDQRIR